MLGHRLHPPKAQHRRSIKTLQPAHPEGRTPDASQLAGNLSHGQKQWLEIGMATSLGPKLLLLGEPTAGMSLEETHATGEMVRALQAEGMTVLAVEHDMNFVREIATRVTVLHFGRIFAQGSIDEIMADDRVAEIYLGHGHGAPRHA
jgi:ABC-type uncharacterized transport system ATPase subunit